MIIILLSTDYLFSQEPSIPCKPDCENSEWVPAFPAEALILSINMCGHIYEVRYRYRFACNMWYDYYIEAVGAGQGTSISDMFNCIDQYGGISNFLKTACEKLIIQNPANFPPNDVGCETNWRVLKGSCWMKDYVTGTGGGLVPPPTPYYSYPCLIRSCTFNDCCLEYFTVCIYQEEGPRVITQTGYLPPESENCNNEVGCVPVCGSVYNR